jgi:hypothetical protein
MRCERRIELQALGLSAILVTLALALTLLVIAWLS